MNKKNKRKKRVDTKVKIVKRKKDNNKYSIIAFIIGILVFALMAILVVTKNSELFDNTIYNIISKCISTPCTYFFKGITALCNTKTIIVLLIIILLFVKNKRTAVAIVLNSVLCVLLNGGVKLLFVRPRPVGLALIHQGGYSFPSGHSMMALAFFGFLIYLVLKSKLDRKYKNILSILLVLLILLIGISRIYLGVHFASDVLGGFALSLSYLVLFINLLYKKMER